MKVGSLKAALFQNGGTVMGHCSSILSNEKALHKEKLLSFDRKAQRLDDFFFKELKIEDRYLELVSIKENDFSLSHDQPSIERGLMILNGLLSGGIMEGIVN